VFSIGKVAKFVGVEAHTIRFWQKQFPHIKHHIGAGCRKYYDNESVEQFKEIKRLMYDKGIKLSGIRNMIYRGKIIDKETVSSEILSVLIANHSDQVHENIKDDSDIHELQMELWQNMVWERCDMNKKEKQFDINAVIEPIRKSIARCSSYIKELEILLAS